MQILIQPDARGRYGGTGFRLPPVIENGHLERCFHPIFRLQIAMFAGKENRTQGFR